MKWLILFGLLAYQAHSADFCEPAKFSGQYGVQLAGTTTISGEIKPVAAIGKLVFDGSGSISGYMSVNFTGLLLGNPVTGSYEAGNDCSLNWKLQDDSGAFQNFTGKITPDFLRIQFHQTDKGAARDGAMVRTPKECSAAVLRPRYNYSIKGSTTPMLPGQTAQRVAANGLLEISDGGKLTIDPAGGSTQGVGNIQVDGECIATFTLGIPGYLAINLRGVLLDDGREILAIQTDAGATVTAKLTAKD